MTNEDYGYQDGHQREAHDGMPDHHRRQRAGKALAGRVVFELAVSLAHDVARAA